MFILLVIIAYFHSTSGEVNGDEVILNDAPIPICKDSDLLSPSKVVGLDFSIVIRKVEESLQIPSYWMSTNETTTFSIIVTDPGCRKSSFKFLYLNGSEPKPENSTEISHFYPNGYFRNLSDIYAPDEYCVESFSESSSEMRIRICPTDCGIGKKRPCIMKCCPIDKIFRGSPGKTSENAAPKPFCISLPPGSSYFSPTFYHDYYTKVSQSGNLTKKEKSTGLMPHYIINHPKSFKENCKNKTVLMSPTSNISAYFFSERFGTSYETNHFRIRTDGAIMYTSLGDKKCETLTRINNICVDGIPGALSDDLESPFTNTEDEYIIFQCPVEENNADMDKYLSFTFGVLLLVTSIFPLMTSIVYILLWRRQNVHGWTIAATSGSLFFMYIFQGTAHIIRITLSQEALNTFYCQLLGILTHFFMMSTFTWLTVMSLDLWLTFRSVAPMNHRLQGVPRYMRYSLFGWGIPTVIVTIGILMDYVIFSANNDCSYHVIPAYGQTTCWIVENALGEYLYYPAGFLLCINISLFTATCMKLCRYRRGAAIRTEKNDHLGECFSRFAKLFWVMGVSWIFEIVGWYVDGLGFVWYWNIFDIFNILRAVGVFVIYVCKKDVMIQLEEAYPSLKRVFRPFGKLFLRKCADEISTESTVFSAMPNSPVIPLKAMNLEGRRGLRGETCKKMDNTLDIPRP